MIRILSLGGDAAGRYLPWLVGLLMFVATLFLAFGLILTDAGTAWQRELSGTVSVQIPVDPLIQPEGYEGVPQEDRITTALELLSQTPGVVSVRRLSDADAAALLQPWLGKATLADALPMPVIIDVRTDPSKPVNFQRLETRLKTASPGAVIDDHSTWLTALSDFTHVAYAVVFSVILLVLFSAVMTVIFMTRTSLAIHGTVVELLHIMGARDSWIARHFQVYAARLVGIGSLAGSAAGVVVVLGLQRHLTGLDEELIPITLLNPAQWVLLGLLPVVSTLLAAVVADRTVARVLNRMV